MLVDPEKEPDLTQFRFQRMQRTKKRKRNKEFVCELQDISEGEVKDTTKGDDVEGEGVHAMEANVRADTSTGNPVDIGTLAMLQNLGGETDVREAQSRTTAKTTITQQQKFPTQAEPTYHPEENSTEEHINESVKETNDYLSRLDEAEGIGGSCVEGIVAHDWRLRQAHFKVE